MFVGLPDFVLKFLGGEIAEHRTDSLGTSQCSPDPTCSPLGKLGRHVEDGAGASSSDVEDPCQPRVGWPKETLNRFLSSVTMTMWSGPGCGREHEQAMMRSQRGPLASTAFTSFLSDRSARFESAPYRVLLRGANLSSAVTVVTSQITDLLDADHSTARQLGCVFQDMKPPKSILRKSSDMQKPIQRVKFTNAVARHTQIRDQNPSLGYICPG